MNFLTNTKTLILAASMLLLGGASVQAKPVKPSGGSSTATLVISKVFYNAQKNYEGKTYLNSAYLQLYNNSTDTLDLTGLYIGMVESHSSADNAWTTDAMQAEHPDSIALKQIFQIPTDSECLLAPGNSLVIANSAIDHSSIAEGAPDLSNADFEVKSANKLYLENHNDAVPALAMVFSFNSSTDYINFTTTGPAGIVLLAADTNLDNCPVGYQRGKTSGSQVTFVPAFKTIDAVDIVAHTKTKSPSAEQKRIGESYDAGFTATANPGAAIGEAVVRKTALCTNGKTYLFDTNNSTNDFVATTDLSIRSYSAEVEGLRDTTIVIPESGYLAFKMDEPFIGPANMLLSYTNASNNNSTTDLKYNTFRSDTIIAMAGEWIAIAKPGTYTLKQASSQATVRVRSSNMEWTDENTVQLTGGKKTRHLFKFVNTSGKVGFERDETYANAENPYSAADFAEGEHLYITITPAIGARICEANGASSFDDLAFISWHGMTPDDAAIAAVSTSVFDFTNSSLRQAGTGLTDVSGYIYNEVLTKDGISLHLVSGSAPSRLTYVNNRDTCLVMYKEYATMNFAAPDGMAITKIEFVQAGNGSSPNLSAELGTLTDYVWEGNVDAVRFSATATSYLASATVTIGAKDGNTEAQVGIPYVAVDNIAAFNALESGTYALLNLTDAEVTGISADGYSTLFLQDATGGVMVQYCSLIPRMQEKTKVSGTVYGVKRTASGNIQLKEAEETTESELTATEISDYTIIEGTIDEVNKAENLGRVVKITGASFEATSTTAGTLTQGESSINVNNGKDTANQQLHKLEDFNKGDTFSDVTIVGILNAVSASKNQILPLSFEGVSTGIMQMVGDGVTPADNYIYNVSGQRTTSNDKGILIKNGRKYIVK